MESEPRRLRLLRRAILRRCNDSSSPDFKWYGARGIKVCALWTEHPSEFVAWAMRTGARRGLLLDRINNDGPYSPDNCRWVTPKESNHNRRNTKHVVHRGKLVPASQLAARYQLKTSTFRSRLDRGDSVRRATREAVRHLPHAITYKGKTYTTREVANRLGMTLSAVRYRIAQGWSPEKIFETPRKPIAG